MHQAAFFRCNPEAYDAYLRGLAFEARSYSSFSFDLGRKAADSYERAVQLDPNFAVAWARLSRADAVIYSNGYDTGPATRREQAKRALDNAQKLEPNSSETLLALGFYQYWVLRDYGPAKSTFVRVSKLLPGNSEAPQAMGLGARRDGHWGESIACFEQALTLDPRNVQLLANAAETYGMLRGFPAALKLYDRAFDIIPNDPDVMAKKASIYQAEGNLLEAARSLPEIDCKASSYYAFTTKITQLRLERNYGEAVRLHQLRQAQFHFDSQYDQAEEQLHFALTQRLAGDTAGANATAGQARNTLEQLDRDQPENVFVVAYLAQAYAVMREKDAALKTAERAIMLRPRNKDAVNGARLEENLAIVQTILGENSRAISTLTQLLQTPFSGWLYTVAPVTPALLRVDPLWDSLRGEPTFQKLCEEKQDQTTNGHQFPEKRRPRI